MTAGEALRAATAQLGTAGVDRAARDARLLLAEAMGIAPGRLTLELAAALSPAAASKFQAAIVARGAGRPVSHILGRKAFWRGEFEVTGATLAPRPETETLVEQALARPFERFLDLGTGTGCIAVSLLGERPMATGVACDISSAALEVAGRNAARHGVADRLTLTVADWFTGIAGRFDLIVSNPPYIAADEMPLLSREVREHDPATALTDGADGLSAYRVIAAEAGRHLAVGGRLLVEIGAAQGQAVSALFTGAGWQGVTLHRDLDGRDRVVEAGGAQVAQPD